MYITKGFFFDRASQYRRRADVCFNIVKCSWELFIPLKYHIPLNEPGKGLASPPQIRDELVDIRKAAPTILWVPEGSLEVGAWWLPSFWQDQHWCPMADHRSQKFTCPNVHFIGFVFSWCLRNLLNMMSWCSSWLVFWRDLTAKSSRNISPFVQPFPKRLPSSPFGM